MTVDVYAHEIARRERLTDEASKVFQEAQKKRDQLRNRVTLLELEKQQIINARAAGGENEDNANRLVIISADLNGLAPLLEYAESESNRLRDDLNTQTELLNKSRAENEKHQAQKEHELLLQKSRELELLLVQVVAKAHEAGQRAGQQHFFYNWQPSQEILRLVKDRVLPKVA
jgi:hypothetical protein